MLKFVHMRNVGPAADMRFDFAPRLNVLTGDNGLGKSFVLDLAWWSLTRTWAGNPALPIDDGGSSIEYVVEGKGGPAKPVISRFRRDDQSWPVNAKRPPMPGIVVYIRIDGGFSVWDPARNYWRTDPARPAAYHFTAEQVWDGLDIGGARACEGLERDWVNWQEARKPQFTVLEKVLAVLSPPSEHLRPGPPRRLFLGEGRDRPTLLIGSHEVPVTLASAGIRRALALAYFLVWAWHEHKVAAQLLNKQPEDRFVVLFDEPETHLHPRWQRQIAPSVLAAVNELRGSTGDAQILMATHSPLVLASLEPIFEESKDELFHLQLVNGQAVVQTGLWAKQGDVANWLTSNVFGLQQARSAEAERAIENAEAFMRGDRNLPTGFRTKKTIHTELLRLLPAHDEFWPRWLVTAKLLRAK
jgi:AAA domain, putative AbiEii toxin, Type IV TA system